MDDGTAVREMIENGPGAKLRLMLEVENRSGLRDASVWGELPGSSDEDIVVMAHHARIFRARSTTPRGWRR